MSRYYERDHFILGQHCYREGCRLPARLKHLRHGHFFCSDRCSQAWLMAELETAYTKAVAQSRLEMPGVRVDYPDEIRQCPKCGDWRLRDLNGVGVICGLGHTIFTRQGATANAWEREMARQVRPL